MLSRLEALGLSTGASNVATNVREAAVEYSTEEYERVISTNLTSAFELTRAAHPLLKRAGGASVVNVSSVSGLTHTSTGAPYAMSKAALLQMTRSLAVEWAADRVRVNAVARGTSARRSSSPSPDPERLARVLARRPCAASAAAEVAAVVAFLASPRLLRHGPVRRIDGGSRLRIR